MVSAGLSAPTASGAGIAASTLSPAASYEIGQYFKSKDAEGSAAHILVHTILGAAVAATGGNNALSAGIAAGGAEATAPLLSQYLYGKDAKDLTASEKSTISTIVGLAGTAVGAITGDVSSTVQSGQSAQNAVENNKTSYKQDLKKAILCWNAKCQQEYKDMEARQKAAYRKGQNQAISKFAEDIKNLPNVPQELYDALRNDPQGTTIAILNGIFAIPGEIINTGVTITKGNLVGSSTSDFEKLGQAEMSATLNTLSGFLSAGAVTVAKKGGKIVLGLKADFDPNLNVQVNGVSGGKSKTNSIDEEKKALDKIKNNPKGENLSSKPNDTVINQQASKRVNQVTAPIDFDGHILSAEVKPNGSVVGGHSTATGNVKVLQVIGKPDKNGVYQARVAVSDKSGQYVNKTNNGGVSTMFPDSWSADRLKVEVDAAYKNRQPVPNKPNMWQGKTPSGVEVTGYLQPKTTVYPKPPMQ